MTSAPTPAKLMNRLSRKTILSSSATHVKQRRIWEQEHKRPAMFPTVNSNVADPGVVRFWNIIDSSNRKTAPYGLEICCGKGRNAIWLAENGARMSAFDFSETA